MTRALRISAREYVAFVRTVGFWLSICLMPLGLVGVMFFSGIAAHSAPTPKLAIVDFTGADYGAALTKVAREGRTPSAIVVAPPPVTDATMATAQIRPYLGRRAHHASRRPAGRGGDRARHGGEAGAGPVDSQHQ